VEFAGYVDSSAACADGQRETAIARLFQKSSESRWQAERQAITCSIAAA